MKKMKRFARKILASSVFMFLLTATACSGNGNNNSQNAMTPNPPRETVSVAAGEEADAEVDAEDPRLAQHGLDENLRFLDTQTISVAIWDRGHERMPDMASNGWTDWIQKEVLEAHNIAVEFVVVPRWDETPFMSTLLGAGSAPDVSFSFGGTALINTFSEMGAMIDMEPLLAEYGDWLPNMYGFLGDNVYWNQNPNTGELFSLASRRVETMNQNTFVREDWLKTLDIEPPTTLQQFEDMLVAFRDNAELLLGADANRMVPLRMSDEASQDVLALVESFLPDSITEREFFKYGFDERRIMQPSTKEAYRVLNKWFDMGLVFQEFAYGDTGLPDDLVRLGVTGAYIGNWDMPMRAGGDQHIVTMRENRGPDANFMPVLSFPNDAGNNVMIAMAPADRVIFLPHTNRNPIASMLYIDWMSRQSTRNFLSHGIEGQHHVVEPDGARRILPAEEHPDNMIFAATNNFDIQFISNGFDFGDEELTLNTLALAYAGIDAADVMRARSTAKAAGRIFRPVFVRPIAAQEGMTTPLAEFRNTIAHNVITTSPDTFDSTWDAMIQQYMDMGGRAIIEERDQAWVEQFGEVDFMPGWEGW